MRVLYVNHTASVSGGELSLLSLLAGLPSDVSPLVACPPGRLLDAVQALGVRATPMTGTAGSLRPHPLHTPRTLLELAAAARQLRAAAARHRAEVVHANSIRAGIMLGLARPPHTARVAHIRDCLPPGALSRATMRLIAATATVIVANSRYTARSVQALAPASRPEVVYNPVDLERWNPERVDRASARASLGAAGQRDLLLGVVGQLSPWKGQATAIEALALARDAGLDAHLLLIGSAKFVARSTRYDNRRYVEQLHELIARSSLEDRVTLLGEREDVPELVAALDALLLPSWEEPFGRALIEGMAMGVPVLATDVGGPAEIIEDGRQGYLLDPRAPAAWARAIGLIAEDRELAARMGREGRRTVAGAFTLEHHVAAMLDVYERAISATGSRARPTGPRARPPRPDSGAGRERANLEKSPRAP